MDVDWYYVEDGKRRGPVKVDFINNLFRDGIISEDSYVWRKGFENWEKLKDVPEIHQEEEEAVNEAPPVIASKESSSLDWNNLSETDNIFNIKIGVDRGGEEALYGPFNFQIMEKLAKELRINEKTLVFVNGMDNWEFLGDLPVYSRLFGKESPSIEESDRRRNLRRPFIARLFFSDDAVVYEGICRDISVGGLQILISDFPGEVGEKISMNVHPENTNLSFVASGIIVRKLEGNQGFSLRFDELNPDSKKVIDQYLLNAG
jgi:hypothetical protein